MKPKYLFIIGAAKSGTTKLADLLDRHEDICLSNPKEPDYFGNRKFNNKNKYWYESVFNDKTAGIRLDASTLYSQGWKSSSKDIPRRIYEFSPNAHIIYMVRQPSKRAWSSYWHSVRNGTEKRTPEDALSDFQSNHIQASSYFKRSQEYLEHFNKDQFHIIFFEDFIKDPKFMVNELLKELEISTIAFSTSIDQATINESYQWSGWFNVLKYIPLGLLQRINNTIKFILPNSITSRLKNIASEPIPKITDDFKAKLDELFKDDYKKMLDEFSSLRIKPETQRLWTESP